MTYAVDLITLCRDVAATCAPPPIRALHLPPLRHSPCDGDNRGEFAAVELADGSVGVAFVLYEDAYETLRTQQASVVGASVLAMIERYGARDAGARVLALAAANALARHVFDTVGWQPPVATDSLGGIEPAAGEHIGMVGFFKPLLKRITAVGARLTVLERKADFVGEHAGAIVTLDAAALARCDKVLITSSVLLNESLDAVLAACGGARDVVLIGPSAGGWPDALFSRGITALGASWVTDPAAFIAMLTRGESTSPVTRKTTLRCSDYPGLAPLLSSSRATQRSS